MKKVAKIAAMILFALVCAPVMALAQEGDAATAAAAATSAMSLTTIGAGLILIGAGLGIGWIGSRAVDSMARQPEVAGSIQTAMIISEALIEGVTFFALIICLLK